MLILAFALLAGSRTCSAVSVECSGCNVVAYTIHSRLSREDIDLHTPETLKASMEATCQVPGAAKRLDGYVALCKAAATASVWTRAHFVARNESTRVRR